jgi:hypothetical protein
VNVARVVLGSYFFRYPLGGMMSYVLQYLVGLARLGHEVWFVEKASYPRACFDARWRSMTDDCSYGVEAGRALLARFGLGDRWCFVDFHGQYFGAEAADIEAVFASADLFIDMGTHGAWARESATSALTVYLDGEPGFRQMNWENQAAAGQPPPRYDRYFTNGLNVGTPSSSAPTCGIEWEHLVHPVVTALHDPAPLARGAAFTTVMNWQSHAPVEFGGRTFGQKDVEFARFLDLPRLSRAPLEVAVAGTSVPRAQLEEAGWRLADAHAATITYDAFIAHAQGALGEFSVCKHVFVATRTGWFSDKSGVFLALARPVIVQDTGWSDHLPTGRGLFAVSSAEEAAVAIEEVVADYERHSTAAREIAGDCLDASRVLGRFLASLGL